MSGFSELAELKSRTLWQAVVESAERVPHRWALVAANDAGEVQRLSYRSLVERAGNLSVGLAGLGVRRGDPVALWMTNTPEWVISTLAATRLGAPVVPINTFLRPAEISYILAQSGARHLLTLDEFRTLRMPQMLTEICPDFTEDATPGYLFSENLPDLRNIVVYNRRGGQHTGAFDFATLENPAQASTAPGAREIADRMMHQVLPSDLGMVKYTSGSTGFPKGVMLEQGGIVANAVLHSRQVGIRESEIWFSMMPFFHGGGSIWGLMTMMVNGGTLVFTEAFNAGLAVDLIAKEQATVHFGVLGEEMVDAAIKAGQVLPSLRIAHVHNDDARKVMPNVTFTIVPFGLTETYGPASVSTPADPGAGSLKNSGRMLPGNECRVVDPQTGRDVAPGEVGEAWLRGNVMRGYWNKPEETARAFDSEGWFHSEDLVSIDADGYVTYMGRLKLMLKVGGENVSIEEVENVVNSHEAVLRCGAVGVPDQRKGEVVRIYVAIRSAPGLTEDDLRDWLGPRLARFKMPRDIVFLDELPLLANGKIDRVTLAKMAEQEVAG